MCEPRSGSTAQLIELAHRRAVETARSRRDLEELRRQVARSAQADAESWQSAAELAVTSAALERLRALPEVKIGQRVRHIVRSLGPSRSDRRADDLQRVTIDDPGGAPAEPASPAVAAGEAPGLGYPDHPPPAAIVVVRDRRQGLLSLLAWLDDHGIERVEIVDDGSTDPATRELLGGLDRPVHRLDADLGAGAPWAIGLVAELSIDEPVLVIDADTIPAPSCPDDAPARMRHELQRCADIDAVELAPADRPAPGGGSVDDGTAVRPDGDRSTARPNFSLVRGALEHLPRRTTVLAAPYAAVCASWATSSLDPGERYARRSREADVD
jgi:hypothetical protein